MTARTSRIWKAILWVGALAFAFDVGTLLDLERQPFVPPPIVHPAAPVKRPIKMPQYLGPDDGY